MSRRRRKKSKVEIQDPWKPWEEIVKACKVGDTIDKAPKIYQRVVALALSVAKWRGSLGVLDLASEVNCGLCWIREANCIGCPLEIVGQRCREQGSFFSNWYYASFRPPNDEALAEKSRTYMHDTLYKLYTEEYWRVFGEE